MPHYSRLLKLLLPVYILGCSSNSEKENIILKEVITSLESSNTNIDKSSQTFLSSLNDMLGDPVTSEKAKIWKTKADEVYQLSKKIFNDVKQIKDELKDAATKEGKISFGNKALVDEFLLANNRAGELINRLNNLKEELFAIDSNIRLEFQGSYLFAKEESADYFFKGSTVLEALTLLTRMQNSIKVNENRIIAFCNNRMGYLDGPSMFSVYHAIVGQSSTIVKPGDEIVISAGVGAFSKAALPKILMNNKEVEINDRAVAILKLKAPKIPGIYKVPVKINFIDEDGNAEVIEETIEYTVSDCKN